MPAQEGKSSFRAPISFPRSLLHSGLLVEGGEGRGNKMNALMEAAGPEGGKPPPFPGGRRASYRRFEMAAPAIEEFMTKPLAKEGAALLSLATDGGAALRARLRAEPGDLLDDGVIGVLLGGPLPEWPDGRALSLIHI